MKYHVYQHLLPTSDQFGRVMSSGDPSPVRSKLTGLPLVFEDLRLATEMAERMQHANRKVGRDHCVNIRFTAGWTP